MKTETDIYITYQVLLQSAVSVLQQFMQESILHWEHMSSDRAQLIHYAYLDSKLNWYFIKSLKLKILKASFYVLLAQMEKQSLNLSETEACRSSKVDKTGKVLCYLLFCVWFFMRKESDNKGCKIRWKDTGMKGHDQKGEILAQGYQHMAFVKATSKWYVSQQTARCFLLLAGKLRISELN